MLLGITIALCMITFILVFRIFLDYYFDSETKKISKKSEKIAKRIKDVDVLIGDNLSNEEKFKLYSMIYNWYLND